MGKVYSLSTYKALIQRLPKDDAINGSVIKDEQGFQIHLNNLKIIEDAKAKGLQPRQDGA